MRVGLFLTGVMLSVKGQPTPRAQEAASQCARLFAVRASRDVLGQPAPGRQLGWMITKADGIEHDMIDAAFSKCIDTVASVRWGATARMREIISVPFWRMI